MSKVWTMTIMMLGIVLLLKFAGIPTGVDSVLNWVGLVDGQLSLSQFFIAVGIFLAGVTASAIVIGFFTKSSFDYIYLAPFAANFFIFVATFVSVIAYANNFSSWIYNLIFIVFAVLGVGYILAIVDWVFNRQ